MRKALPPSKKKQSALMFMADITGDILECTWLFIMSALVFIVWFVVVEPAFYILKDLFKHERPQQQPDNVSVGLHTVGTSEPQAYEKSVFC